MAQTFYFWAGEFQAEGMGWHYHRNAIWFTIDAPTLNEAKKLAHKHAESVFGKQEKKDMWYGIVTENWITTPTTQWFYDRKKF